MRILHVITSLDPRGGGPSEAVRQLGSELVRENIADVQVATLDAPGSPWLAAFPLTVHALGPSYLGYSYAPRLVPWLRENAHRFDCVIANGIWQYASYGVWRALKDSTTPYFVFPHGMLDPWFKHHYPLKHFKKWLYWPWAEYCVLRDARAVLFTCEEERRLARQSFWLYRCRECVVNYGTAAPTGDPARQREIFLAEYPELRSRRLLLFLGRIHEKKGCDLLVQAFAEVTSCATLNAQPPPLHLVLAGPCAQLAYLAQLRALAERLCPPGAVSFPGMLSGDLKWGAFYAADVFVLPSHQENFGIAVAEAMACGLPVLISDKVNIWREIEEAGAGIVDEDTLKGTCQLLSAWLEMPTATKEATRAAAKVCFDQKFEVHRAATSLQTALSDQIRPLMSERNAFTGPSFPLSNRLARAVWNLVQATLFRLSPRPCHRWRAWLLRLFGAKLGRGCHIYPRAIIWAPWNLTCGDEVGVGDGAILYNQAPIQLGKRVVISQGAHLCTGTHDYTSDRFPLLARPIVVGNLAWVAAEAFVHPGVTIGEGAVIGARSVVTKDMPAWMVCAGHPCQPLKEKIMKPS